MKKRRVKLKLFLIATIIIVVIVRNYFSACNIIEAKAKAQFEADSSSAFYSAINFCLNDGDDFDELIKVEKNADGNVSFVSTNALKLNNLTRRTAVKSLEKLNEKSGSFVKIPLGAYFGIKLFSGYGAETNVKLIKITSVKCDFINDFASCGINRVIQRCFVLVEFDAKIILPTKTENVSAKFRMPVYDNFIAGEVPKTFLNGVVAGYTLKNDD